jgi:hypothetical protein
MLEMICNTQACLKSGENIKNRLKFFCETADSALDNFVEVALLPVDVSVCFALNVSLTHPHR